MYIYGCALLAICLLAGNFIGLLLGALTGFGTNIGGVGFAAILLLVINLIRPIDRMQIKTQEGIHFWQGMFLPVVVAMTASQDVVHAIDGGLLALLAGVVPVFIAFALMPVLIHGIRKGEE